MGINLLALLLWRADKNMCLDNARYCEFPLIPKNYRSFAGFKNLDLCLHDFLLNDPKTEFQADKTPLF
jgi:hypothetical protein